MENILANKFMLLLRKSYPSIKIYKHKNKIVFYDDKLKKKIYINTQFLSNYKKHLSEPKNRTESLLYPSFIKYKNNRKTLLYELLIKYLSKIHLNKEFWKKENKITIYNDMGFYKNNYAEFLINLQSNIHFSHGMECKSYSVNKNCYEKRNNLYEALYLNNFNIDNIKVEISKPSVTFKVIMDNIDGKTLNYKNSSTIKMYGIKKEEVENYLQYLIFQINRHDFYFYLGGNMRIIGMKELPSNNEPFLVLPNKNTFTFSKEYQHHFKFPNYIEPIICFNYARAIHNNFSFLYYYKVLEFFFKINYEKEMKNIINEVDEELKETVKLNFVQKYKKELDKLTFFIENLNNDINLFENIIKRCDEETLTENIANLINKKSIENFSKELYKYRNKFVHLDLNTNFELLLPSIFDNSKIIEWTHIVGILSYICILHYCFDEV